MSCILRLAYFPQMLGLLLVCIPYFSVCVWHECMHVCARTPEDERQRTEVRSLFQLLFTFIFELGSLTKLGFIGSAKQYG